MAAEATIGLRKPSAGGGDRYVGAGTGRQAQVGRGQRRGVVDRPPWSRKNMA
jgi:hypothetical protein